MLVIRPQFLVKDILLKVINKLKDNSVELLK